MNNDVIFRIFFIDTNVKWKNDISEVKQCIKMKLLNDFKQEQHTKEKQNR